MSFPELNIEKWASVLKNICFVVLISALLVYFIINMKKGDKSPPEDKKNDTFIIDGAFFKTYGKTVYIMKNDKKASLPTLICEAIFLDMVFNNTSPFMSQYGVSINGLLVEIKNIMIDFNKPKAIETLGKIVGVTL